MKLSLSGAWRYALDENDAGLEEKWYEKTLDNEGFILPGTTASNQVGSRLSEDVALSRQSVKSLKQRYKYVGAAWYQKELTLPREFAGKYAELFLERVMFESRVFINGTEAGRCDSLSTPHVYNLTGLVKAGETFTLSIRIDNRDVEKIGSNPSAYTDETQTIWNGIVGEIALIAKEAVHVKDLQVYPNIHTGTVLVKARVMNMTGLAVSYPIHTEICDNNQTAARLDISYDALPGESMAEYALKLKDFQLWDEFHPYIYHIKANGCERTFGMREFKAAGKKFTVNGKATFLRGTLDCCIFPLTGYPATDRVEWERILKTVKDYGLNHVRYHSWCPPEAAFAVADELGLYINVEGPMWMDTWNGTLAGQYPEHYKYLPEEALRILDAYGNHPSFVMYANGNELNGDWQFLSDMIKTCKAHDPRHVYTLTTNWDRKTDPEDDYFVAQTSDGLPLRGQYKLDALAKGTAVEYNEAANRNIPIVVHEVGQYSVYPDIREIPKFTGVLRAINYESIQYDLEKRSLVQYAVDFTQGSGALALEMYKADIEAILHTKGLAGLQLLDLHDFPGQFTATVGILNCFWESKGLTTPDKFRQFFNSVVPLAIADSRIYQADETFKADLEIANYGDQDLKGVQVKWELKESTQIIASGVLENCDARQGEVSFVGSITAGFKALKESAQVSLTVCIDNTPYINSWKLWVYKEEETPKPEAVIEVSRFDEIAVKALAEGKNVLLTPRAEEIKGSTAGSFFPVFWSPVHFTSKAPLGIIVQNNHPVFDRFPTGRYVDFQWKDVLEKSFSIDLNGFPADFTPFVQVIPNFFNNHKAANLFEARVLNGKLLVCSIDLNNDRNPAKALRRSIYSYITGTRFEPEYTLALADIENLFKPLDLGADSMGTDLALKKQAFASSVKDDGHSAEKGNDGNPLTSWQARDYSAGESWTVDLGKVYEITGTEITFLEAENYLYALYLSLDGEHFELSVNQTGQVSKDRVRRDAFTGKGRYVKMIYSGLPGGVAAGHSAFKVFGKNE